MSFTALAWAASQRPSRSSEKLLLLALADRHNTEDNIAYPSIAWLADFTGLNRKTVISTISRLEGSKYIEDTGVRFGVTLQVKAYRLLFDRKETSRPAEAKVHYVYRLTSDDGGFYLGVRTCDRDPDDDPYTGSGSWPTLMRLSGTTIRKEVIAVFPSRALAEQAESALIERALRKPECMNKIVKKGTVPILPKSPNRESQKRDTEPVKEPTLEDKSSKECHAREEEIELDLGLPALPPKDPTPGDVAAFVIEQFEARPFARAIRGGRLIEANAEKARDLGRDYAIPGQSALDTWRDIFTAIDGSDFLQGKSPPSPGRTPFRLNLGFLLEKRNFEKVLGGRYDGKSSGGDQRGSTSKATGRVIERIRASHQRSAGGRDKALTHG